MATTNISNSIDKNSNTESLIKKIIKSFYITLVNNLFMMSKFKIVERDIRNTINTFIPTVPVQLLEITEKNLLKISEREKEKKVELFRERLRKGNYGLMVLVEEKIAGYAWVLFKNEKSKLGINIKIKEDEAICKDVLVFQEFRNNKIHKYFLSELMQRLSKRNISKLLAAYLESNKYSERAALSNGFVIVAKTIMIRILGIKFQFTFKSK